MSPRVLSFLLLVDSEAMTNKRDDGGPTSHGHRIVGVVDRSSRVGKEQKLAMEMAVHDFHDDQMSTSSYKLVLHLVDSYGNSARALSADPSIFAFQAYDATWAIAKAMQISQRERKPKGLVNHILSSDFEGLSRRIRFNKGRLSELPTFRIINVIGKSYREVAFWSPVFGFSEDFIKQDEMKKRTGNGLVGDLDSIYWADRERTVPRGWSLAEGEKLLKIGVPARGAFTQFVNVSYDSSRNETSVTGFSIEVFEAAVKRLPYDLPHVFVPYYGSYDEMVAEVHNKSLDAAVGDTEIIAERYNLAEFSQPYMDSGLVMVVSVKSDSRKERFMFMKAFTTKMWVLMATISISIGLVVWFIEHVNNNPEYRSSFPHQIGEMLWFSVTVLSFSQRESIKNNLSRVVLATWFFVIVTVSACFTAVLSSMMTVQRLQPSVIDIEYLQRTNAAVGCDGNSFIMGYLVNVLHFKQENIKSINSMNDYPEAFQRGEIKAAFFVDPHAKVFLATYCEGYTKAGDSFKLGGFGFVFQKGSPLVSDISEAILEVTESGEINKLEKHKLSFSNCSSSGGISNDPSLDYVPFSGLFTISGCISSAALLITIANLLERRQPITSFIQASLISTRVCRWASLLLILCYSRFGFQFFRESYNRRTNDQMNVPDAQEENLMDIELARNHNV